jgi:hypothetical protein
MRTRSDNCPRGTGVDTSADIAFHRYGCFIRCARDARTIIFASHIGLNRGVELKRQRRHWVRKPRGAQPITSDRKLLLNRAAFVLSDFSFGPSESGGREDRARLGARDRTPTLAPRREPSAAKIGSGPRQDRTTYDGRP